MGLLARALEQRGDRRAPLDRSEHDASDGGPASMTSCEGHFARAPQPPTTPRLPGTANSCWED